MVKLDDLDISILSFVADHPSCTVTDCAKSLFNPKNTEDLQRKDSMLRHRFKSLSSEKYLLETKNNNHSVFRIDNNLIHFGPELRFLNVGGEKFIHKDLVKDYCIIIYTKDGVVIKSLDKLEKKYSS
ncbi:MAG: hypothetical protein BEU00_03120 [Marine Group III euryarchaeote CG-Epi3]|jgi:hypothetical protein|uniref:Uncharacterized protein n=1 Tax=Marine Group III euryarchaeote CG-Epi3 TaxID=1888997 RepID=A0A1J5U3H0_9ARCH|nr:MAG: hypothetical protein BEU00_03120 [Marine Group III euryarchaeote CG-Epi3]